MSGEQGRKMEWKTQAREPSTQGEQFFSGRQDNERGAQWAVE